MKDNHTKGPWEYHLNEPFTVFPGHSIKAGYGAKCPIALLWVGGGTKGKPTQLANTKLITAAVNSYDKHCGDRAVECAEGDLLGECLGVLDRLLVWWRQGETRTMAEGIIKNAEELRAKTKGER